MHELRLSSLIYPTGDPAVEKAMNDLCRPGEGGDRRDAGREGRVRETSCGRTWRRRTTTTLAYYHYDFPDDVYWLGPLLDPVAGKDGRTILGYRGASTRMVQGR